MRDPSSLPILEGIAREAENPHCYLHAVKALLAWNEPEIDALLGELLAKRETEIGATAEPTRWGVENLRRLLSERPRIYEDD